MQQTVSAALRSDGCLCGQTGNTAAGPEAVIVAVSLHVGACVHLCVCVVC